MYTELRNELRKRTQAHLRRKFEPALRPGTMDRFIWQAVTSEVEYGRIDFFGKVVVDIGAHIGAFSYLAASRGARYVLAIEPEPENFDLLARNAAHYQGVIDLLNAAVFERDEAVRLLKFRSCNTGGHTLSTFRNDEPPDAQVLTVQGITFKSIYDRVRSRSPVIDILKLDCEGAERYVLSEIFSVDYPVRFIVGEAHYLDPSIFPDPSRLSIIRDSGSLYVFWYNHRLD